MYCQLSVRALQFLAVLDARPRISPAAVGAECRRALVYLRTDRQTLFVVRACLRAAYI